MFVKIYRVCFVIIILETLIAGSIGMSTLLNVFMENILLSNRCHPPQICCTPRLFYHVKFDFSNHSIWSRIVKTRIVNRKLTFIASSELNETTKNIIDRDKKHKKLLNKQRPYIVGNYLITVHISNVKENIIQKIIHVVHTFLKLQYYVAIKSEIISSAKRNNSVKFRCHYININFWTSSN